jgi:hypothetical protein
MFLYKGSMRLQQAVLSLAGLALVFSGCDDEATTTAPQATSNVRVIHLSPDAPAVDVFLNGQRSVQSLAFEQGTAYLEPNAGTYDVAVAAASAPVTESVLSVPGVQLAAGKFYTAVALGRVASIQALALEDNYDGLASGNIRVRAIHAASAVGQVDIWNIPSTGSPGILYENVDFAQAGGYLDLPAGAYTIGFDVNNDASPDVVFSLPALAAGSVANVFAVSDASSNVYLLAQLQNNAVVRVNPS